MFKEKRITPKCSLVGCEKPRHARGYCMQHYARLIRFGTIDLAAFHPVKANGECRYECARPAVAGGACAVHHGHAIRDGLAAPVKNMKAHRRAYVAEWKRANWTEYGAYLKARKAHVKRATPAWADLKAITNFYRDCPKGMHVDHIIPLRGKTVSGLHVLPNLRYISAKANMSKGARYQPVRYDPLGLMAGA